MTTHPLDKFKFCPACGSAPFEVNNETSKRCAACGFVYYFNPRAAVAVVVKNDKGQMLAVRRAKEPAKGTLDLPGGFSESYETAEQSVQREVREETGLELTDIKYLFSLPNIYRYSDFDVHTMDMIFEATAVNPKQLVARDDVAESFFVSLDSLSASDFGLTSISEAIAKLKDGAL